MKEVIYTEPDTQLFNDELERVNRKNILITGGTTDFGRSTILLAPQEAQVMIFDRHEQEFKEAVHNIQATGGQSTG